MILQLCMINSALSNSDFTFMLYTAYEIQSTRVTKLPLKYNEVGIGYRAFILTRVIFRNLKLTMHNG